MDHAVNFLKVHLDRSSSALVPLPLVEAVSGAAATFAAFFAARFAAFFFVPEAFALYTRPALTVMMRAKVAGRTCVAASAWRGRPNARESQPPKTAEAVVQWQEAARGGDHSASVARKGNDPISGTRTRQDNEDDEDDDFRPCEGVSEELWGL